MAKFLIKKTTCLCPFSRNGFANASFHSELCKYDVFARQDQLL